MILKYETSQGDWGYFGEVQGVIAGPPQKMTSEQINQLYSAQRIPDTREMFSIGSFVKEDPIEKYVRRIQFEYGGKQADLLTTNEAYLLNDHGKTVERV